MRNIFRWARICAVIHFGASNRKGEYLLKGERLGCVDVQMDINCWRPIGECVRGIFEYMTKEGR